MIVKYLKVITTKQNVRLDKLGINFNKEYIYKTTEKNKYRSQLNKVIVEVK